MHYIGIDIGTSSISGVAYDHEKKEIESVTLNNDSAIASLESWEKKQDPERIMELVRNILDDFGRRYSDIKGIGVTGQMHGILYIDSAGESVSPLFTWQDGRGNRIYKDDKTYAAWLSETTGCTLATGYGLVTHFYNQANGFIPKRADRLCTIMDYVVMKLSQRKTPLTDFSNGASLGFFDVERLRFDEAALETAGIDPAILPQLDQSATCCGYYRDTIPVYSAIGDNQAAFSGSVKDIRKSIHVTVGTSSQISVYTEKYVKIPLLDTRPFPGGGYLLVGAALCGGQAFVMLKNFFEQTLNTFIGELPEELDIYRIMTSVPYRSEGADLLVVKTLFDGTRFTPSKRGQIENISLTNFTPGNLIMGFLKGISGELHDFYHSLPEDIRNRKNVIVGSGNALKKNRLLCKAFEEQFDAKMSFSPCQEEAAFGVCLSIIEKTM
jgi:sedoheptulokinase